MAAGIAVTVVDVRPHDASAVEASALRAAGCEVLAGHTVLESQGRRRVSALIVAPVDASGKIGARRTLECDCVGLSGGWTPAVHLFSQSRGKLAFDTDIDAFVPAASVQAGRSAGAACGTYQLSACLAEGWRAGAAAASLARERRFTASATRIGFRPVRLLPGDGPEGQGRAFVDLQNDVTAKDIGLAVREGFRVDRARQALHHHRHGDGPGRDIGHECPGPSGGGAQQTDGRHRHHHVPAALYACHLRRPGGPRRGAVRSRAHAADARLGRGARCNVRGRRPAEARPLLSLAGEDMHAAVVRECMAVRRRVGLLDASTLGKIEVVGPDAAEFLDRIYTNDFARLQPGRCRYGLMLKEDGSIFDDGVVARLAPDRFHVTTTTGGAGRVLQHMEDYLQTEWPGLEVYLTSITEQYAVIAVQGPQSREMLAPLVEGWTWAGGVPAHVGALRLHVRGAMPAVPRLVHGRARIRDQRARRLRATALGSLDGTRAGTRRHALRHRGDACAAGGEGLHHREPGDGRHGDA
jgi:sarcosine oxidase subunit alpha